eukprot:c9148_g1_i1.p1 GENE.c9148_g1_i1~~c9148_g1_i1.p1  ORF type:complete len:490 (+),score=117.70 c9148_g1_i1:149-1471(+)
MEVLVVGGGGREHALAWKLAQSTQVSKVWVLPGNAGTAQGHPKIANVSGVSLDDPEHAEVVRFVDHHRIGYVVVGPEKPLVDGLCDVLRKHNVKCFGPGKVGAHLEASKAFSKEFMNKYNIPTATHRTFTSFNEAWEYARQLPHRVVVKASGLAAGKGVVLPENNQELEKALREIMVDRIFGDAGDEVVLEEYLEGEEVSCLAFTDGNHVVAMPGAQDHKRVFENDAGPNTGGMGAYAPAPVLTAALRDTVMHTVLQRTIEGLKAEGITYVGIIYAGIMLTKDGVKVLEYNCRFGDPETQVLMALLDSDLLEVMLACSNGTLASCPVNWKQGYAITVICASGGYPGPYENGKAISLPTHMHNDAIVFHSGTKFVDSQLVTWGGRVLAVTAFADSIPSAVALAYTTIAGPESASESGIRQGVWFEGMHFRKDIAHRALKHV